MTQHESILSKKCGKCHEIKGIDHFRSKGVFSSKGFMLYQSYCKPCMHKNNLRWQRENPECHRKRNRAWQQANPERVANLTNKRRASKAGNGGHVSAKDWERILNRFNRRCAYCGEPGTGQDHVVPISRGGKHTIGNLLPCCTLCNNRKHARFLVEWRNNSNRPASR